MPAINREMIAPTPMLHPPKPGHRTRLLTIAYGLLVFLWFTPEDNHIYPAALLGLGLSALTVGTLALNRVGGRAFPAGQVAPGMVIVGLLIGLGASVATAALMFFKNALHAHLFLDFPPQMMLAILERAPVWALAGGLSGLGLAFAWWAWWQRNDEPDPRRG